MRLWLVMIYLVLLSGCAAWFRDTPSRSTDETQKAIEFVWRHYGQLPPTPAVRSVYPDDLRDSEKCTGKSGRTGFWDLYSGLCIAGFTFPGGDSGCAVLIVVEK